MGRVPVLMKLARACIYGSQGMTKHLVLSQ